MVKKKKELFEYEDEPFHKPFDFINKDLDLLFLLIFFEAFKSQKEELNFGGFFKGNYWDIDQVSDEISDSNDYYSIPDMVLEQALFIFEDTRMGKVIEVGIYNVDEAVKDLLIEVAKIGPENARKEAPNYYSSFQQLFFLDHQKTEQFHKDAEKNPELITQRAWKDKSIFFTKERGYFRTLQSIIIDLPTHILIRVKYNEERIKEIEKEIADYLDTFSKDQQLEQLPRYQEKRLYFAQQIENFYSYISRLNLIGDTINIPFTILSETGFEAVKILRFLELNGKIKMRWSDEGSWKVQFLKLPITPESLLGAIKPETAPKPNSLKSGLSFNEPTSTLSIGEHSLKINGPDQKEFLKIIFKDQKELGKEWFFSEIAEVYDFAGNTGDKKFYNASYQLNLKVAQKTPIKDFLITTKQSVRVNPIYL